MRFSNKKEKLPNFNELFIIVVIGSISTSKQDFRRVVGIGSIEQCFVEEFIIIFLKVYCPKTYTPNELVKISNLYFLAINIIIFIIIN